MIHDIFIPFVGDKFEEMGFTKLWDPDKVVLIYDYLHKLVQYKNLYRHWHQCRHASHTAAVLHHECIPVAVRSVHHTALRDSVTVEGDRKSTRLNSSHSAKSRMPSSA